jgi:hypothetical protein
MKITKSQLRQIIKEELAEAQGVEFPRLGTGYSDEDVEWGEPTGLSPENRQQALDDLRREVEHLLSIGATPEIILDTVNTALG